MGLGLGDQGWEVGFQANFGRILAVAKAEVFPSFLGKCAGTVQLRLLLQLEPLVVHMMNEPKLKNVWVQRLVGRCVASIGVLPLGNQMCRALPTNTYTKPISSAALLHWNSPKQYSPHANMIRSAEIRKFMQPHTQNKHTHKNK